MTIEHPRCEHCGRVRYRQGDRGCTAPYGSDCSRARMKRLERVLRRIMRSYETGDYAHEWCREALYPGRKP